MLKSDENTDRGSLLCSVLGDVTHAEFPAHIVSVEHLSFVNCHRKWDLSKFCSSFPGGAGEVAKHAMDGRRHGAEGDEESRSEEELAHG